MRFYDFAISAADYLGVSCYVFAATAKRPQPDQPDRDVVINELITTSLRIHFEIVGRKVFSSYKTWVFDFNVRMDVQMTKKNDLIIPAPLPTTVPGMCLQKTGDRLFRCPVQTGLIHHRYRSVLLRTALCTGVAAFQYPDIGAHVQFNASLAPCSKPTPGSVV